MSRSHEIWLGMGIGIGFMIAWQHNLFGASDMFDNTYTSSSTCVLSKISNYSIITDIITYIFSHASTSPDPYIRHDPVYFNTPCLTPPSTPGSLPPPLFICNPYDTTAFGDMDTREWIQMDRRDIGGGKRRRRDNMKKCRKVYGIDNRDLWCTQCKWKKACVRFQMGSYHSQRHF